MKNSYRISALLALSLGLGTASIQAMEKKENVGRIKKQFNESLDRFSRCMRGKCTRWEALKVARDLGITAAAVVGAIYVGRRVVSGNGSRLSKNMAEEDALDLAKIKEFFPLGTAIATSYQSLRKGTMSEEPDFKGIVVDYGTISKFSSTSEGYVQLWPALKIKVSDSEERILLPVYAERTALPKPEEE